MKPIREHLVVSGAAFRRLDEPAFAPYWHTHPEWELTLITAGSGVRLVGDHVSAFGPVEAVLLGPDLPHAWTSPVPSPTRARAAVVHFGAALAGLVGTLPDGGQVAQLLEAARRGVLFPRLPTQLRDAVGSMAASDSVGARQVGTLLHVLADLAELDWQALSSAAMTGLSGSTRRRIDDVSCFLLDRHTRQVTLGDAAAIVCMSPAAFSRFFRHAMGRTFTDYLTELRVTTACTLLCETDDPITSVAEQAGFANLANFNRRFLQRKAMTPSEYRRATRTAVALTSVGSS
jgi:AraC-like DNA-binding protein